MLSSRNLCMCMVLIAVLLSCKGREQYPPLIDEEPVKYMDEDFRVTPGIQDYLVYKDATTKNSKLKASAVEKAESYPWEQSFSKDLGEQVLNQMEKHFSAIPNESAAARHEPADKLLLSTLIELSPAEQKELTATGVIRVKNPVVEQIKGKVLNYDLADEKGQKVKVNNDFLGINMGGIQEKDQKSYSGFAFEIIGFNSKYTALKGFVEIEIEIPAGYQFKAVSPKDAGDHLTVDNQKIEVLAFEDNAFHFKLDSDKDAKFELFFRNCDNSYDTGIAIPENIYKKFRAAPGLDYPGFEKKRTAFGLVANADNSGQRDIWIYKSKTCKIEEVFFYWADDAETVKRKVRIPVDIKVF